ncbi:MAG: hypothetical protein JWP81_2503 [Ferruginibacter sp.]|nr:hypothetical protein [Ferruginibacter sp.]
MQADTITGSIVDKQFFDNNSEAVEYLKKQKERSYLKNNKETTGLDVGDQVLKEYIRQFDDRKEHPLKPDSIIQVNVNVKYKRNELGTLIFRDLYLIYYPKEKKFIVRKTE